MQISVDSLREGKGDTGRLLMSPAFASGELKMLWTYIEVMNVPKATGLYTFKWSLKLAAHKLVVLLPRSLYFTKVKVLSALHV